MGTSTVGAALGAGVDGPGLGEAGGPPAAGGSLFSVFVGSGIFCRIFVGARAGDESFEFCPLSLGFFFDCGSFWSRFGVFSLVLRLL